MSAMEEAKAGLLLVELILHFTSFSHHCYNMTHILEWICPLDTFVFTSVTFTMWQFSLIENVISIISKSSVWFDVKCIAKANTLRIHRKDKQALVSNGNWKCHTNQRYLL